LGVASLIAWLLGWAPPPESQSRYWAPIARPDRAAGRGPGVGGGDDPRGGGPPGGPPGRPGGSDREDRDPPDPDPVVPPEPDAGRPRGTGDGGVPAGSLCSARVSVPPATPRRAYRPRNVGVIWVTDSGNRFVKTLTVWANRRASNLSQWSGVTGRAGTSRKKVAAVPSATASNHGTRNATWNCTDFTREPVPDGTYKIC